MAGGAAELRRLHVLHCPIGNLGSNQDVHNGRDAKEPGNAPQCGLAIDNRFRESLTNLSFAEVDPDRHQDQAGEEDQRKNQEDDDSNVRIVNVPTNLEWQHEQPRNHRGRDQSSAEQT